MGLPVWPSHSRAVLSSDAVTMRVPSGLNTALHTESSWPLSGSPMSLPVWSSELSQGKNSGRCAVSAVPLISLFRSWSLLLGQRPRNCYRRVSPGN
jgi:hypothetical protein